MKVKLLFLTALFITNIGLSQNLFKQFEGIEDTVTLDINLALLDDTTSTLSKIVDQYNAIQDEDFAISPNPSKDKLNIKLPSVSEDLKLEVFDVLGKRIYKGSVTKLESSINVSNWKSGVYLVRISNDKSSKTKRFIKQ